MPSDIKNFYIAEEGNTFRVYTSHSTEDETVESNQLTFTPGAGHQWYTTDKEDQKTIKKALTSFLGYEPSV